jgi:hypothetical protein
MDEEELNYINKYKLNEWLIDEPDTIATIKFKNRIEHKLGKKYHSLTEAAIIYLDKSKPDEYYIYGEKYSDIEKWKHDALILNRSEKIENFI